MSDYLNGQSYPTILIKTVAGVNVTSFDLELCGENGLIESYTEDFKRVTLRKNKRLVDYDFQGCRIRFSLDYSEYIQADMVLKIENLTAYFTQPDVYKIILYPRSDQPLRFFEVRLEDANYSLGLLPDRVGHTLPVINFITTQTVSKNFQSSEIQAFPLQYYIHNDSGIVPVP